MPSLLNFEKKIKTLNELKVLKNTLASPIIFTNGVFDILHRGHVTYLARARALGQCLIVGVNSDASARRLAKGDDRPFNNENDRMALLAALESVDAVIGFEENTPFELIENLKPDVIVKGGDYNMETLPETVLVKSWGGTACAISFEYQTSTTALVNKIRHAPLSR